MGKIFGVLAGGAILLAVILGGFYNSLVQKDVGVDQAWAQVENVLQRRSDLIPNLVATVKGYAKHEREVLDGLARARTQYAGAHGPSEKMAAAQEMGGYLSRLLVIVENYPNLKANENFNRLMDELSGTENRISVERMRYNEAVGAFNGAIRRVPGNLFAGVMGFKARPFFEADQAARTVPKVEFEAK